MSLDVAGTMSTVFGVTGIKFPFFFIIAMIQSLKEAISDIFQEWISLGPIERPRRSEATQSNLSNGVIHDSYLRLLLGKNEDYKPFFIKGEDDEKGYPKSTM